MWCRHLGPARTSRLISMIGPASISQPRAITVENTSSVAASTSTIAIAGSSSRGGALVERAIPRPQLPSRPRRVSRSARSAGALPGGTLHRNLRPSARYSPIVASITASASPSSSAENITSLSPPLVTDGVMICSQPGRSITRTSGSGGYACRVTTITSSKISCADSDTTRQPSTARPRSRTAATAESFAARRDPEHHDRLIRGRACHPDPARRWFGRARAPSHQRGLDPADACRDRLLAQDAEGPAAQLVGRCDVRAAAELAADHVAGRAVGDRVDRDDGAVLLAERAERAQSTRRGLGHRCALDDEVAREPAVDQGRDAVELVGREPVGVREVEPQALARDVRSALDDVGVEEAAVDGHARTKRSRKDRHPLDKYPRTGNTYFL